jgi:hypothetical protein
MAFKKIKNYKTFILEMLAIFIGISASFWLANYRTSLEEAELSEKYLQGFIRDLEEDLVQLDTLIDVRERQSKSAKVLLNIIEINTLDVDTFYNNYYFLFPFWKFIPNTNTMEQWRKC